MCRLVLVFLLVLVGCATKKPEQEQLEPKHLVVSSEARPVTEESLRSDLLTLAAFNLTPNERKHIEKISDLEILRTYLIKLADRKYDYWSKKSIQTLSEFCEAQRGALELKRRGLWTQELNEKMSRVQDIVDREDAEYQEQCDRLLEIRMHLNNWNK